MELKRMAPNFKTTTLAHSRFSLILTITTWLEALLVNMSKFIVSTYVSWKIPLYQSYKR